MIMYISNLPINNGKAEGLYTFILYLLSLIRL